MGFDGDAALALQVHRVEDLLHHFALRERAGDFEQAVGQRRLAVVDVRNDREIADEFADPCGMMMLVKHPPSVSHMSYNHIVFETAADGIALVTVNRPEKLNALNAATVVRAGGRLSARARAIRRFAR